MYLDEVDAVPWMDLIIQGDCHVKGPSIARWNSYISSVDWMLELVLDFWPHGMKELALRVYRDRDPVLACMFVSVQLSSCMDVVS